MDASNFDIETLFAGGRLCLDFINTSCMRRGTPLEFIGSTGELKEWLRKAEIMTGKPLCDEDMEVAEAELARAHVLRSALHELVHSAIEERVPSPDAVRAVNATLSAAPAYSQIGYGEDGFGESVESAQPGDRWLTAIAQDAVDLLCRSDLSLVRECGCPTCVRVFYDTTKNHKRRWCVEKCGSAPKAAAYYRRKVARAAQGDTITNEHDTQAPDTASDIPSADGREHVAGHER